MLKNIGKAGCLWIMVILAVCFSCIAGMCITAGAVVAKTAAVDAAHEAAWQVSPRNPAPTLWESWRAENPQGSNDQGAAASASSHRRSRHHHRADD